MPSALRTGARWVLGFVVNVFLPTIVAMLPAMAKPDWSSCSPLTNTSSIGSLRELPGELQQELTSKLPDLVDRDEPFKATDVGHGPRRRFITAVRAGSRWVIAYEHGGIGYHIHVVAFDWPNQQESPSLIFNRQIFPNWFCEEISARLRNEPIPADRSDAEGWKY